GSEDADAAEGRRGRGGEERNRRPRGAPDGPQARTALPLHPGERPLRKRPGRLIVVRAGIPRPVLRRPIAARLMCGLEKESKALRTLLAGIGAAVLLAACAPNQISRTDYYALYNPQT